MYKVIVLEDEHKIRKGLIYSMNWEENGCIVVADGEDGKEGIELINKYKPDIVITDIEMPYLNGLAMVDIAKDQHDFETIIVTGYSDFEYAKAGIKLGVVEYVLKPIDFNELEDALKRCIQVIQMKRRYQREITTSRLKTLNSELKNEKIKEMVQYINKHYNEKLIMKDFVDMYQLSSTHLHNEFKRNVGLNFNEYINYVRIRKAIKMIQEGNLPIYEIAEMTGFNDYKYFHKVFIKYTGIPPKEMKLTLDKQSLIEK